MSKTIDFVDDDGSFEKKYIAKRNNAKAKNNAFTLTRAEMATLLKKAGIKASDWGMIGRYDLARYGDLGGYTPGNCRFITHQENLQELRPTERRKEASLKNVQLALAGAKDKQEKHPKRFQELCLLRASRCMETRRKALLAKDAEIVRVLSKKRIIQTGWGWKTRLSEELGITVRELGGFLKRNPFYAE